MSIDDKAGEQPRPKSGLSSVLRQIEQHSVPVLVQGELRKLILEYHSIYARTFIDLQGKHERMSENAIHSVASIRAEKAFGEYLEKVYHGKD